MIQEISKENHSLSFILKMSEVQSIDSEGLRITVPYSFHKDKIEEHKTKKTVEKCLSDFFSERIFLRCEVLSHNSGTPLTAGENDAELIKLAADFGGEII